MTLQHSLLKKVSHKFALPVRYRSGHKLTQIQKQGVPILDQLAKKYNVNRDEIVDMANNGKISLEELTTSLSDLAKENDKFAGSLNANSSSAAQTFGSLKDQVLETLGNLVTPLVTVSKLIVDLFSPITEAFREASSGIRAISISLETLIKKSNIFDGLKYLVESIFQPLGKGLREIVIQFGKLFEEVLKINPLFQKNNDELNIFVVVGNVVRVLITHIVNSIKILGAAFTALVITISETGKILSKVFDPREWENLGSSSRGSLKKISNSWKDFGSTIGTTVDD